MNGPQILFVLPVAGGIPVTETVVNTWLVMAFILCMALWLASGLKKQPSKKQVVAETLVNTWYSLVANTMGKDKLRFAPYTGTLFILSLCSNFLGLFGLRPPTADLNTPLAWAIVNFFMIQFLGIRIRGFFGWLHKFIEPIPLIMPLNFIGEFSTPVSMTFRHFGNLAAGLAITSLLYSGLAALSNICFGWLTSIPILQVGLPAVLSIYFDIFTGCLQAFIFSMLTMVFVSNAMD